MKKILSIVMVLTMIVASASFVFADSSKSKSSKATAETLQNEAKNEIKAEKKELKAEAKNEIKTKKEAFLETKKQLLSQKSQIEDQTTEIEKELESAIENGDEELQNKLKVQLQELKNEYLEAKEQIKTNLRERQKLVLENYTQEEITDIEEATENIQSEDSSVKVLDVTSILSSETEFKFDTPPVIKEGRTLIPVRAITEGFGAEVDWNSESKEVTITKDDTTITLTLGNNVAIVNGEEVTLDTKANTMNKRTYVPLRFIMETFNKQVSYDNGIVEIEDKDDIIEGEGDTESEINDSEETDVNSDTVDNEDDKTADETTSDSAINTSL
ncbi:stalk domain-containing protein [Anaerovorax odorimutans]|uniref:stalk domain-containing protein n=1 Tax=Anaerovorax odorimutans TaxID=109327 RepID=UPI0003FFA517|nr:stalk domain-containing protein [Anaerovorax odorimutans]